MKYITSRQNRDITKRVKLLSSSVFDDIISSEFLVANTVKNRKSQMKQFVNQPLWSKQIIKAYFETKQD